MKSLFYIGGIALKHDKTRAIEPGMPDVYAVIAASETDAFAKIEGKMSDVELLATHELNHLWQD